MQKKLIRASVLSLLSVSASSFVYAASSNVAPTHFVAVTTQSPIFDIASIETLRPAMEQNTSYDIPQVSNLLKAQTDYQNYVMQGGWKSLRQGDKIEPGSDDPRIPALRERLRAEGYSVTPNEIIPFLQVLATEVAKGTEYDEDLVELVKVFQKRHGLDNDGVIGPATLKALNESAESKLNRINQTLADWAEYDGLGETHIWANIPSFNVQAWKNNTLEVEMNTVVGARKTATPAFSDEIEYMVANPKWFLPTSLFARQKLRKLQADPSYAAKYNYRIYDRASGEELNAHAVNWFEDGISSKIRMVQDAGPTNALGNVKIIFPNENSIYLHGTPDTHLFARSNRALSSGCIRLEDPEKMANWIANIDTRVAANEFTETLHSKTRKHFPLAEHIPVHITYMTVTADQDGQVSFWQDIYQKQDAPLMVETVYKDYEMTIQPYQQSLASGESINLN